MNLMKIRQNLDEIDMELMALLNQRMELSEQVARYKLENNKPVLDHEREEEKLSSVAKMADTKFNEKAARALFAQLMSMSRKLQYTLMEQNETKESAQFFPVDRLVKEGARVVYQGIEGAYSQEALYRYFGRDTSSSNVSSWREAMEEIADGNADYAVLPIENSTAGSVTDIYDLLNEFDNCIVGEQILKVEHALLGLKEAEQSDIKTVYSHPQALMQSEGFLRGHKEWKQINVDNTAGAAYKIAQEKDKTQVAIASPHAADIYGLKVLQEKINDEETNATRFIIVTGKKIYRKDAKKITICFELPHESGSLYDILSNFVFHGINMTKIESRPLEDKNWEYYFIVDFEGNLQEPNVSNALLGIKNEAASLKILGNY